MSVILGRKVTLAKGGLSTSFTNQPTTKKGLVFQIADKGRRVLDGDVPIVVKVNGVTQTEDKYGIDFFVGEITFKVAPSGAVTVDGAYIPTSAIAGANQFSLNVSKESIDVTDFDIANTNGGYKKESGGVLKGALSLEVFNYSDNAFNRKFEKDELVLVIIQLKKDKNIAGWYSVVSLSTTSDPNSAVSSDVSLSLSKRGISNQLHWS